MKPAAFALSLALATTPAIADVSGDPVTLETLLDRAEMIRVADAIDAAVDAKDWTAARAHFTDEITVDFTSLIGGEPATIPADALIAGWSANLTEEKTSFHLRGNHRISFDGPDAAQMQSHGYAWNRMERGALPENGGEALWEVWGTYEHGFVRTEAGWQVDAMSFVATAERGNGFVRNTPGS
ncbi:MAG: nuclear transport factor 2 family protein [Pseudomonadota bacterium]